MKKTVCLLLALGNAGKGRFCDPQIAVTLVVLQKDVVAGLVALDEGVFQHQGFKFRADHNGVKGIHGGHHGPGLFRVGGGLLKILADPVFQFLGFSDIDNRARRVQHKVNAWGERQAIRFTAKETNLLRSKISSTNGTQETPVRKSVRLSRQKPSAETESVHKSRTVINAIRT